MPSSYSSSQPAKRQPPKSPTKVLAEAEQQWIFTEEELLQSPSIVDGMKPEEEREARSKGVNFILQVGQMLKLPASSLHTAVVFLNRFLMRRSLKPRDGVKPLHHYQVAATSIFLATKVEENVRKLKDIIIACCRVAQKKPDMLVDEQTKDFWRWRDTILYNEDILLETICFDLTVESPQRVLFDLLQYYRVEHHKKLRNAAWAFINDTNITQLCLLFTTKTIAAASLYCGARLCEVSFPDENGKPWWEVQRVRLKDIIRACNYMTNLYEHVTPKGDAENIYVGLRTPADEDPRLDRTRLRTSQSPHSPAVSIGMERSSSEQSLKRKRGDEVEKVEARPGPTNGTGSRRPSKESVSGKDETTADRVSKRPKTEPNGAVPVRSKAPPENGAKAHNDENEGSEEGEVSE